MQNSFTLNSASITDRGLSEKRPQNEDSYLSVPEKGIFVVADGVGGSQSGEVASQMATEVLEQAFGQWEESIDAEDLMLRAIQHANGAIYQMSHDLPSLASMATTIVALHLDGNIATIGHVGDSRLYRLDPRGNLFRETQDHSVVEEEVRAGRMTVMQAATHPSRNVISRALGAEKNVEVDMKTIMFEKDTQFLLCSDGITRHINEIEIRELLLTCQSPTEACREMKSLCFARGAEDNLTAIIVKAETLQDIEESTLAASRYGYENQNGEIPTQSLQNEAVTFQNSNSQISVASPETTDNAMFRMENAMAVSSDDDNRQYEKMKLERAEIIQSSKKGFFGKLLTWLILLGLGFVLGAFGLFGYQQVTNVTANSPATPPQTVAPQTNVSENLFAGFETNRRSVDSNPAEYIKTNAQSADEAEDFYLLGRAYLRVADYPKAKENFKKAKDMLPFTPESNRKTLELEISAFIAIMADQDAIRVFEKDRMSVVAPANEANKEAPKPQ